MWLQLTRPDRYPWRIREEPAAEQASVSLPQSVPAQDAGAGPTAEGTHSTNKQGGADRGAQLQPSKSSSSAQPAAPGVQPMPATAESAVSRPEQEADRYPRTQGQELQVSGLLLRARMAWLHFCEWPGGAERVRRRCCC